MEGFATVMMEVLDNHLVMYGSSIGFQTLCIYVQGLGTSALSDGNLAAHGYCFLFSQISSAVTLGLQQHPLHACSILSPA